MATTDDEVTTIIQTVLAWMSTYGRHECTDIELQDLRDRLRGITPPLRQPQHSDLHAQELLRKLEQVRQDMRNYGTGWLRLDSDESMHRVDPRKIMLPNGKTMIDHAQEHKLLPGWENE